jgi:hypothetical protein
MSDDFRTSFLTYYIQSLGERTRDEKRGTKFGFDWIIYNLALAEDWAPHRLPFLRAGSEETSNAKSEAEFGVDLAFLSSDQQTLRVFVLKDEVLNNANWGGNNFDIDLRNASAPDLTRPELSKVKHVEVILAYNKDEDRNGIELYERRVAGLGSRVGDHVSLAFDRWNLTRIVEKVKSSLLTPSLLPQKFFSHFSYICSQFADFRHGSDEWANQLIPNWRRFLGTVLPEKADERSMRLLPVALLILREHGKENPTAETAWIDLIEWAMLAAWRAVQVSTDRNRLGETVWQMWIKFYVAELERYYSAHLKEMHVRHSLDIRLSGSLVDAIASAIVAHWHITRLGILGIAYAESLVMVSEPGGQDYLEPATAVSNWLVGILMANPSAMRPIIDLHQIELFLVWFSLMRSGRIADMHTWFQILSNRLLVRRIGHGQIPFIEGSNATQLVFEYVASGEKPDEFCDTSSVFLTCLMEMICALPPAQRDPLLESVYTQLVLGHDSSGTQMDKCEPIDLMSWVPPTDWGDQVLVQSLANEGECTTINLASFDCNHKLSGSDIAETLRRLTVETRKERVSTYPEGIPHAVIFLACSKHQSPLPPEFWRGTVFPPKPEPKEPA